MRPDRTIELAARLLDESGAGVGEAENLQIHASGLLPGERGRVAIEHVSPHRARAWGRCVERLGADSPDRVSPACPAFGHCGGCAWQHLAYPAQLRAKRARVVDALAGALADPPEVADAIAAPVQLCYRNKGKYVVGEVDGRLTLGAYRPRTHTLVDTAGCRQVSPEIDRAAGAVRTVLEESGAPSFDESTRRGVWRYVVARASAGGEVLIHLVTSTSADPAAMQAVGRAILDRPPIAGVTWAAHDRASGAILGGTTVHLGGKRALTEALAGVDVALDATSFFQVNRAQAARIYADIAERTGAAPGVRAIDLYCGVGGIAFALADRGAEVLGIEIDATAVATASAAATANTRFVRGTASSLADHRGGAGEILTVNPPRKGLDAATRAAIIDLAPATLGYLSCGPQSLARDLAALVDAGYRIESVTPYDLMPGTAQIETLAILRR